MKKAIVNAATGEVTIVDMTAEEQADVAAAAAAETAVAYKAQRTAEYPPMADYVDGIVKGDTAQVQAYVDACLAVKAKYPKPDAP